MTAVSRLEGRLLESNIPGCLFARIADGGFFSKRAFLYTCRIQTCRRSIVCALVHTKRRSCRPLHGRHGDKGNIASTAQTMHVGSVGALPSVAAGARSAAWTGLVYRVETRAWRHPKLRRAAWIPVTAHQGWMSPSETSGSRHSFVW